MNVKIFISEVSTQSEARKISKICHPEFLTDWQNMMTKVFCTGAKVSGLCIKDHFKVQNNHLLVDGHILNIIYFIINMNQDDAVFDLVFKIRQFLKTAGSGLFGTYSTELDSTEQYLITKYES